MSETSEKHPRSSIDLQVNGAVLDELLGKRLAQLRLRVHVRTTNRTIATQTFPGGVESTVHFDDIEKEDLRAAIIIIDGRHDDTWHTHIVSMHNRLFDRISRFPDPLREDSKHLYTAENLRFLSAVASPAHRATARARYQKALRALFSADLEGQRSDCWSGWTGGLPPTGTELADMLFMLAVVARWVANWSNAAESRSPSTYAADSRPSREAFLRANREDFLYVSSLAPERSIGTRLAVGLALSGLGQYADASDHFIEAWKRDSTMCRVLGLPKRRPLPHLETDAIDTATTRPPVWNPEILTSIGDATDLSVTILLSGNPKFLKSYLHRTATQIAALRGVAWHYHVIGTRAEAGRLADSLKRVLSDIADATGSTELLSHLRVSFSSEIGAREVDSLAFYASARFLRARDILSALQTDLWILDADAFFKADPVNLIPSLHQSPVTLTAGSVVDSLVPWASVLGWSVHFTYSPRGREHASRLGAITWAYLQAGGTWMLDQVALNQFYIETQKEPANAGSVSLNRLADEVIINFHSSLASLYEALSAR